MRRPRRRIQEQAVVTWIAMSSEADHSPFAARRLHEILSNKPSRRCWSDHDTPTSDRPPAALAAPERDDSDE